jgi:hypothetical protein
MLEKESKVTDQARMLMKEYVDVFFGAGNKDDLVYKLSQRKGEVAEAPLANTICRAMFWQN